MKKISKLFYSGTKNEICVSLVYSENVNEILFPFPLYTRETQISFFVPDLIIFSLLLIDDFSKRKIKQKACVAPWKLSRLSRPLSGPGLFLLILLIFECQFLFFPYCKPTFHPLAFVSLYYCFHWSSFTLLRSPLISNDSQTKNQRSFDIPTTSEEYSKKSMNFLHGPS